MPLFATSKAGSGEAFARHALVLWAAASIWEIAIKSSLRRKDFRIDLPQLLETLPEMGLIALPITAVHTAGVARLLPIHRDPC